MQKMCKTNMMLASFPRSGNTWVRLLISDMVLRGQGIDPPRAWKLNSFFVVQETEEQERNPRITLPFKIVKTHSGYKEIFKRALYVFRDPADCLTSYYHYKIREGVNVPDIDTFCLSRIPSWCSHMASWIVAKEQRGRNINFISYEQLKKDGVRVLTGIADFLCIPVDDAIIKQVLENQSFEKLATTAGVKVGSEHFFRKGIVGSGKQELKPETVEKIESKTRTVYVHATALSTQIEQKISQKK